MPLNKTSRAAAVVAAVRNAPLASVARFKRKILIIGQYDQTTHTDVVQNTLYQVISAEDVGAKFGYGFMLHRLAIWAFLGSGGDIETWCIPQQLAIGGYSSITIRFQTTGSLGGIIPLYIAGERVAVTTAKDDADTDIREAVKAAINGNRNMPIVASGSLQGYVTLTAKDRGGWGDLISVNHSLQHGDNMPVGITVTTLPTFLTGGYFLPDIQDALDATGLNDERNSYGFTDLIHGYQHVGEPE